MLFNSYSFIFLFLPATLLGFQLLSRSGNRRAVYLWLVSASLFYYGVWNPPYLALIIASIVLNFLLGQKLCASPGTPGSRILLILGICTNLLVLGYYKYAGFFANNMNALLGTELTFGQIILPLAISFFTFQQIAYLADSFRGESKGYSLIDYTLFVTFFPQLIAGPIVHHKEMMPQFERPLIGITVSNFSVGISMFSIGLAKKVLVADYLALLVSPAFAQAGLGATPTTFEVWMATTAYAFQLYFDFSGYSDMAMGLSRMFGITLPVNFYSPYKSASIIDFWRTWHITLSHFLRDYVYIPLGGNRLGIGRRYANLIITMGIGGLWHGAGWTFLIWGLLHGLYLIINQTYRYLLGNRMPRTSFGYILICRGLTFVAILIGLVVFRSGDFASAKIMMGSMFGMPSFDLSAQNLHRLPVSMALIATLIFIWFMPNTCQLMRKWEPAQHLAHVPDQTLVPALDKIEWHPNLAWAVLIGLMLFFSLIALGKPSEFLYYQF